jgi:hypothetical protein
MQKLLSSESSLRYFHKKINFHIIRQKRNGKRKGKRNEKQKKPRQNSYAFRQAK